MLSFIKHALVSDTLRASLQTRQSTHKKGLGLDDLKIVGNEDSDERDSDDEDGGTESQTDLGGGRDEIVVTAITLLLSILEGIILLVHILGQFLGFVL